jgi:hypothetical protein
MMQTEQLTDDDRKIRKLFRNASVASGTLIQTARGHVPIEQVEIGDEVYTHLARYRLVKEVLHRPFGSKMMKIDSGENSLIVRPTQPLFIERGHVQWILAEEIVAGDHIPYTLALISAVCRYSLKQAQIEPFQDIKEMPTPIVYGLEVQEDHSYIANTFIVRDNRVYRGR